MDTCRDELALGVALGAAGASLLLCLLPHIVWLMRGVRRPSGGGMPPSPDSARKGAKKKRRKRASALDTRSRVELRAAMEAAADEEDMAAPDVVVVRAAGDEVPAPAAAAAPISYAETGRRRARPRPAARGASHWRAKTCVEAKETEATPDAFAPAARRDVAVGRDGDEMIFRMETMRADTWADVFDPEATAFYPATRLWSTSRSSSTSSATATSASTGTSSSGRSRTGTRPSSASASPRNPRSASATPGAPSTVLAPSRRVRPSPRAPWTSPGDASPPIRPSPTKPRIYTTSDGPGPIATPRGDRGGRADALGAPECPACCRLPPLYVVSHNILGVTKPYIIL